MGDRDEAVKAAMAGIVCYLNLRPEARDTTEGIRRWWLADVGMELSETDVLAALEQLLQHGRVTCMTLPDGTRLFAGKGVDDNRHPS